MLVPSTQMIEDKKEGEKLRKEVIDSHKERTNRVAKNSNIKVAQSSE